MEVLGKYLAGGDKARLAGWEQHKTVNRNGHPTYTRGQHFYRRRLGDAAADQAPAGNMARFTGVEREREPSPRVDHDPAERIRDMDYEGVDVNLTLPSGWFGTWTTGDDVALLQQPVIPESAEQSDRSGRSAPAAGARLRRGDAGCELLAIFDAQNERIDGER
jgi:hypothetical protein